METGKCPYCEQTTLKVLCDTEVCMNEDCKQVIRRMAA
jgi:hypothetical protein